MKNEHTRTSLSIESLKQAFDDNLFYLQGRSYDAATLNDQYMAASYTVRERLLERWIKTAHTYKQQNSRTVSYLSAEFLLGPHLGNNLINMGIMDKAQKAAVEMGLNINEIFEQEAEPGLGNGGLGRLAACYMDSLATQEIPAIGYGIRYEFGIFEQQIEDGWQVELTDNWLRNGNPWELVRPKLNFKVMFGGKTEHYEDIDGRKIMKWVPELIVSGVAYDTPILGYGVNNTNLLRLWKSQACKTFDFTAFNQGDYYRAVHEQVIAENISKVLYPNDEMEVGKELRLKQQYFLFGLTVAQVEELWKHNYTPRLIYENDKELKAAIDLVNSGLFSHGDHQLFKPLTDNLLNHDPYLLLADYRSYVDCQSEVERAFRDPEHWAHMSILNVARMGKFSSDRAIREYCEEIWEVQPVPVSLD